MKSHLKIVAQDRAIRPASVGPAAPSGANPASPTLQKEANASVAREDEPATGERSAAGRAFWATMRWIALVAAAVDMWYFVLFRYLGVPELAWPNISSVALYLTAYALLRLRANTAAMTLIWIEVVLHATAGTLLIGWESGFHYYMLLFIPAIVATCSSLSKRLLLVVLFVCYAGLDVCSYLFGATAPIPEVVLALVRWTNMAIVFAMLSHAAIIYRARLRHAEDRIRISATHDLQTGLVNRQHFLAMTEYVIALQRRGGRQASLALIEIDQLQQPSSPQGEAADRMLTHVSHLLRNCCRQEDVIARWQGDELIAMLPDTNLEQAAAGAERMREAVSAGTLCLHGAAQRCTVSIGVVEMLPYEPFHEALLRAEHALEESRSRGRNCTRAEPWPTQAASSPAVA